MNLYKRSIVVFILLFIFCNSRGQVFVHGRLVDSESGDPIMYANVHNKLSGSVSNDKGEFQIIIKSGEEIGISYVGLPDHLITNITDSRDSINLGDITLLNLGSTMYVTREEKKFLSKKTRLVCRLEDNRQEPTKDMLEIKCGDNSIRYVWKYVNNDSERRLEVSYLDIKPHCD